MNRSHEYDDSMSEIGAINPEMLLCQIFLRLLIKVSRYSARILGFNFLIALSCHFNESDFDQTCLMILLSRLISVPVVKAAYATGSVFF